MKKVTTILVLVSLSSTVFAGGYSFDCSNKDATIVISDRGDAIKVYDESYTSNIALKGLEIWVPLEDAAQTEVVAIGKRTVLHKETDNSCRDTGTLNFAQKLLIRDMKTKKEIASDYFVCKNSYATTTGGRDCSSSAGK